MNDFRTDSLLLEAHTELSKWQSPEDFVRVVKATDALLESSTLFNKTNINFLFDALTLASFVKLQPPEKVRLAGRKEQWPDGFTGTPKAFTNVEITEVMEPGRRRGEEYQLKNASRTLKPDRPEDWRARGAQIPEALEAAIKKKISKNYAVKPLLLVELNINDYGLLQTETVEAIAKLKAQYARAFQAINVIWKRALY
jgi:hypothetical protein